MPLISARHCSSSVQQLEGALRQRPSGWSGCDVAKPGQARDRLVDLRVVLHRAGAERVEPESTREVPAREPREVADDVELGDLGQRRAARRAGAPPESATRVGSGHVERRQRVAAAGPGRLRSKMQRLLAREAAAGVAAALGAVRSCPSVRSRRASPTSTADRAVDLVARGQLGRADRGSGGPELRVRSAPSVDAADDRRRSRSAREHVAPRRRQPRRRTR